MMFFILVSMAATALMFAAVPVVTFGLMLETCRSRSNASK